jgi:hypothetical protein
MKLAKAEQRGRNMARQEKRREEKHVCVCLYELKMPPKRSKGSG